MHRSATLSSSERISLLGNLSTMLTAGIPIFDAVSAILADSKGHQRQILAVLKEDLMQGKHLWKSFSNFPRAFDNVTVNLIRAAEEGGTLSTVLRDLRDYTQRDVEFTDKVKFALLYPVIIFIVFSGVFFMILTVVIPKISVVFSRLRIPLPLPTRILIFGSDLLLKHTWPLAGSVAAMLLLLVVIYKRNRQALFSFLFSFPLISRLIVEIDLTRVTRSLALLLNSGIPITVALELVRDVVLKPRTARLIDATREMVLSGKRLSDGLRTGKGYVPSIVITLIEAGEKSGVLDKAMADIAVFLDYQVSNTLKTLAAVLEPVLLVLVGVSVGGMMLAIITPIYGLVGKLGGR